MKEEYKYGIFIDNEKVPAIIGRKLWVLEALALTETFKRWLPVVKKLPRKIVYDVKTEKRIVKIVKEDLLVYSEDLDQ